ncbi:HlyD family secretion protein [Dysgonomonas sp. 25]|uniref:HlyD family secretion protein n=1 Tax=Dysgonomonas sp. 25 TaxID=2302933 RepID=UPI0013D8506A|nr:HlyD family efflux transporter periplasmic adaptor subunit [Dysgonomonas sp. 25]NDV68612.1 HlyD family efflux transporter periplasmic adaptor subunit [Dysgonomonas sp. 25]
MKQLFPVEIQHNTVQNLYVKRHSKSKIIYLVVIIVLLLVCISLPFIYVDISSQSRGIIRTPHENNTLQSAIYGEITSINIYENKPVSIGDTLICLRSDELEEQITRNRQKQIENNEFISDLSNLISGRNNLISPKYKSEYAQYKAKLSERTVSLNQAKKEYQVSKTLYERGVESKFDFEQVESKYQSEQSLLSSLKQQQINTWQAEKTRLEHENRNLQSEVFQLEKRKTQYCITAPVSGNIVQYTGLKAGNFLSPSQPIALITTGDSLLVECYVNPNDIGYIYKGQNVKFQVDAYDYQQWGLLEGEVIDIISDVAQMENQSFFRVRCSLNKDYLELPNGYKGTLKKGMSLTGRFYLTERSLAQLLFDRIDDWINPKIITNGN